MAGDAVVHPATRHRGDGNQKQHDECQQRHTKPVTKLGQMADQRHLGAIALLLVLFSHNASALCQRFGRAVVLGVGRNPVAGLARKVADFLDVVR